MRCHPMRGWHCNRTASALHHSSCHPVGICGSRHHQSRAPSRCKCTSRCCLPRTHRGARLSCRLMQSTSGRPWHKLPQWSPRCHTDHTRPGTRPLRTNPLRNHNLPGSTRGYSSIPTCSWRQLRELAFHRDTCRIHPTLRPMLDRLSSLMRCRCHTKRRYHGGKHHNCVP